jgi:hypothetical protein
MAQIAVHWTNLGMSLASAFLFGLFFSLVVRWASRKHLIGQTAWAVAIGVAGTLLIMIPVFGLTLVAWMFVFFAASGVPMIVEYLLRIQSAMQQDEKKAKDLAKDLLTK